MRNEQPGFTARLRSAAGLDRHTPLILLGNFEVERRWGAGEPGLPTFSTPASDLVVYRMDEFTLALAGPQDIVVLKARPDAGYAGYLTSLGLRLPRIVVPAHSEPGRDVTEDALHDPAVIRALAGSGGAIQAHGVSTLEEQLAAKCGISLASPSSAVCKAVNSKVYSRQLADRLGLRQPAGWWCEDRGHWQDALAWARKIVAQGTSVVLKDAFGVSGKGMMVVDSERRLDTLDRMITARARRHGTDRLGIVVEQWVGKSADLNYQFIVDRDGSVHFDFVKRALTEHGVHKGHLMPAGLGDAVADQIVEAARLIGAALAADGYYGVVGVDAMLDPDGGLYPVIEINARNNMSTYQETLRERLIGPGQVALARHYPVRPGEPVSFDEIRSVLGDLLLTEPGGSGLVVNNFATVNAAVAAGGEGRLYGIVTAPDQAGVVSLDEQITGRLTAWQGRSAA